MTITLKELADFCGARLEGGEETTVIQSAADITAAESGQVTQLTNSRYAHHLKNSTASACIIGENFPVTDVPENVALLICTDPELSFIKAVELLHPERSYLPGIAPQAVLEANITLGNATYIGPYAIIGEQTQIGDSSEILAGAYIGKNVKIGNNCRIYPYAVIYDDVEIGDNVIIHSGAIIGADGFGYKFRNGQHIKVPQVGNVVIGNNVEIGANTCVDRGALGSTVIGAGSKIDNLVQIGHNNKIGQGVIMCGLTGVSGSCTIEDYAILAGSSGVADHVTIGRGAVIMARSGVAGNVAAGAQMFGSPAKDKKTAYKEQIALSKLPDLLKTVKLLEEKIKQLEQQSPSAE
ncbi:MAG: UDP-3-O-(3-hydroxymyristoyl)glucosamine N-acyltransferase [Methylococcaceae bacterium]|nr:UDP-3-O-(3-hydroxymyristoyl)glucosamine N-acyltransferase [Methylococcaceae bacterium]MDP2394958.1 UDP-3-O-(3-hydroxymyristoyl)glucosamine N-acyltransferase [Methylococcaceae bacterium]MDP3019484.1 UDP-3-O-(3-hydroxymyristoyl)glucosamine N-acyltransferase [Methylococcaceae bacterium]MDP3389474.1 UDP-3-O-(3-hydroxymyristoyl)glucosamine N-acyltransferase [Methylococcaceae bacterium]MDP3932009.1 UDP-3-O-(3-hydroxymyristoyl)glucosamine N-acyltransferase [Methylococcaceae bacterium]